MGIEEIAIVILVVGARLLLPLAIPYWPLPGVVACLVLDAVDQTIFQQFPAIELDGYQSYDKALDIYYLAITYLSTMRNWTNVPAFRMSQFLYYYRLVGVVAFELSGARALLLIFPNTFEYFFIFCEAVRMRWDTARMGKWTVLVSAAAIWVFIKLPQEWWIHIAKLDMTEFVKESLFGASASETWGAAIAGRPLVLVALVAALAAVVYAVYWVAVHKAPPGDHRLRLKADPLPAALQGAELYGRARTDGKLFDRALLEKTVLVGLISVVFAQILLGEDAQNVGVMLFMAVFVAVNALVSQWLARRGRTWKSVATELVGMAVVNFGIIAVLGVLQRVLGIIEEGAPIAATLFFLFLLTVLIVLFDRYHTVFRTRARLGLEAAE